MSIPALSIVTPYASPAPPTAPGNSQGPRPATNAAPVAAPSDRDGDRDAGQSADDRRIQVSQIAAAGENSAIGAIVQALLADQTAAPASSKSQPSPSDSATSIASALGAPGLLAPSAKTLFSIAAPATQSANGRAAQAVAGGRLSLTA